MADSAVPIQPATPTTAVAPIGIRTFTVTDSNGNILQLQGFAVVDDQNRSFVPMSESTGQAIVAAIKELHTAFALANGGVGPTT